MENQISSHASVKRMTPGVFNCSYAIYNTSRVQIQTKWLSTLCFCAFSPLPFGVLEGTKAKQPNKSGFETLVFLCGNVQFAGGVQSATPEHALFSTD
jgi:hypothetical protein